MTDTIPEDLGPTEIENDDVAIEPDLAEDDPMAATSDIDPADLPDTDGEELDD